MSEPLPLAPGRPLGAVLLCLVSAAILAVTCLSQRWISNGNERVSAQYGLIRNTECRVGECTTRPNRELPVLLQRHPPEPISPAFVPAGYATVGVAAVAIVALVICALIGVTKGHVRLPVSPASLALLALMAALVTATVFIATKPGGKAGLGVDWAFIVFGAGVVAGIAGAQRVAAFVRATDEGSL